MNLRDLKAEYAAEKAAKQAKRDGRSMPKTRGGSGPNEAASSIPMGMSAMEAAAPVFKSAEEYNQWMDGKCSRREVATDFRRLSQGMVYAMSVAEALKEEQHVLLRMLFDTKLIDSKLYQQYVEKQLAFKQFCDSLNQKGSEIIPMKEKIEAIIDWNDDPEHLRVRGAFCQGLVEFLQDPNCGLTPKERLDYCSGLLLKEEDILSQEEMAALIVEMTNTPVAAEEAFPEGSPEADEILKTAKGGGDLVARVVDTLAKDVGPGSAYQLEAEANARLAATKEEEVNN